MPKSNKHLIVESLSREDLVLKVVQLRAENTLLRKQIVEAGKDKAYIEELDNKIRECAKEILELRKELVKVKERNRVLMRIKNK